MLSRKFTNTYLIKLNRGNEMDIYNRNCNATRYLEIKRFERAEKRKMLVANILCLSAVGLYVCACIQLVGAYL